jgi:hypothetical protein
VAHSNVPAGLAVASSGDVYFAEFNTYRIKRLRPDGVVEDVAGTGANGGCGAPNNVEALSASLVNVTGLALDEAAGRLYFTDAYCHLVRWVDLTVTPNRVYLLAGGGIASADPYGDGPDPWQANFSSPSQLGVFGGSVYVSDPGHIRIRRIDLATGAVSTFLKQGNCNLPSIQLTGCGDNRGCQVAQDVSGNVLVTGQYCNGGIPWGSNAVMKVTGLDASGSVASLSHWAGRSDGSAGEATVATSAKFAGTPSIHPSPDGSLWTIDDNRLRFIPASAPGVPGLPGVALISTWAGSLTAGSAAEYEARSVTAPQFNQPYAVGNYPGGHLILSDRNNHSLRIIW